jgi:hypothetical protein
VDKSLVWMHGYNVDAEAARGTYAEVFKRFFHAGLTGRFYGVTWFGNPPAPFMDLGLPPHYHQAVVNAFATSIAYKEFINSIPGTTSMAAHSLGNLVVGSAIQDHVPDVGLLNYDKYFAIDAAVALEAYGQAVDISSMVDPDGSLANDPNSDMVNVSHWPTYIAAGQSRLLASEWYKLFADSVPADNRKELTWRGRLLGVVNDNVYNFYSSTEEVLRRYSGDDIAQFVDLLKQLKNGGSDAVKDYLAISTWVKQEKFKGRRSFFDVFDNFGGVSSTFCGWSFNHDWDVEDDAGFTFRRTPSQVDYAALESDNFSELKTKPFFDLPKSDLGDLVSEIDGVTPSEFIMKPVSETGLKSYYTDNLAAQKLVAVRDWLLAEAFPATTLPMGAYENSLLRNDIQNVDMSGDSSDPQIECCKTSEALWPREEDGEPVWHHSDYKDISYQHVFSFYKKIEELIGY